MRSLRHMQMMHFAVFEDLSEYVRIIQKLRQETIPVHWESPTHNAAQRNQNELTHNFTHSSGIIKDIHSE